MSVLEFWDQTPRETYLTIEAWLWRDERIQRQQIALAWRTAALTRAKRLPALKQLLSAGPARPLAGRELAKRRKEFQEATANVDLNQLGRLLKKEPSK